MTVRELALHVPSLSEQALEKLEIYHKLLCEYNKVMDLTNVPDEEMPRRHFLESLLPLVNAAWFPTGARLIDVGTGAGLPGLPLLIARPDMTGTLMDSQRKRCDFLRECVKELNLANVEIVNFRAEDGARGEMREAYDLALARAVAPLNVLAEYLMPYLKIGGFALCWKGPMAESEAPAALRAASLLGGEARPYLSLPLDGRDSRVYPFKKISRTLPLYPRKSGMPAKLPLGEKAVK